MKGPVILVSTGGPGGWRAEADWPRTRWTLSDP